MRGHDHARPVHAGERRHIRSKLRQDLGVLEQSHVIEGVDENLNWSDAQRFGELLWCRDWFGRSRREIHDVARMRRFTFKGPLAEWKTTLLRAGSSRSMTTAALASVAWPQSGTSTAGVNQRKR